MNSLKLVIMGKMATGKTFASDYYVDNYNACSWTTSERIKQISHALVDQTGNLGELLEIVIPDIENRKQANYQLLKFADNYELEPGKPRHLYQEVGQILRDISEDCKFCWEEDLERRIQATNSEFTVIDLRSKESYSYFCLQRGYLSLKITAPLDIRKSRLLSRDKFALTNQELLNHQSETDVDELEFDFVINNSEDDPANYKKQLDEIYNQLNIHFNS